MSKCHTCGGSGVEFGEGVPGPCDTCTPRVWSKRKGASTPPRNAVLVDRSTVYGNPCALPKDARKWTLGAQREYIETTFGAYLRGRPDLVALVRQHLAGRHLVCWCAPLPCHADILLRVAAGGEP